MVYWGGLPRVEVVYWALFDATVWFILFYFTKILILIIKYVNIKRCLELSAQHLRTKYDGILKRNFTKRQLSSCLWWVTGTWSQKYKTRQGLPRWWFFYESWRNLECRHYRRTKYSGTSEWWRNMPQENLFLKNNRY